MTKNNFVIIGKNSNLYQNMKKAKLFNDNIIEYSTNEFIESDLSQQNFTNYTFIIFSWGNIKDYKETYLNLVNKINTTKCSNVIMTMTMYCFLDNDKNKIMDRNKINMGYICPNPNDYSKIKMYQEKIFIEKCNKKIGLLYINLIQNLSPWIEFKNQKKRSYPITIKKDFEIPTTNIQQIIKDFDLIATKLRNNKLFRKYRR